MFPNTNKSSNGYVLLDGVNTFVFTNHSYIATFDDPLVMSRF